MKSFTIKIATKRKKKVSIEKIKIDFKLLQSDIDEMTTKYEVEIISNNFQVMRVPNYE